MSEILIEYMCGACGRTFASLDGGLLPKHPIRLDQALECDGSRRPACRPVSIEIGLLFLDEVERHKRPDLDEACSTFEDVVAVRDLYFEQNGRALLLELRECRHELLKCRQARDQLTRRLNRLLTLLPEQLKNDVNGST